MNCYYCGDIATKLKKIKVVYFSDSISKPVKPLCDNCCDSHPKVKS